MQRSQIGWCALFTCLASAACTSALPTESALPRTDGNSALSPFRSSAFAVEISTTRRQVRVSAPSAASAASLFSAAGAPEPGTGLHASLLSSDAVEILASNYSAGAIGGTVPGKILITFDLTIVNRLREVRLITPTFPYPPANVTGIQAFPLEVVALTTAGGVTATSGVITVASPRAGTAVPSADWDGAPHSFFNDAGCGATASDCFRYEPFGALEAQAASAPRRVGFLVDPTVGDVRIRIIVAADLQSRTR